MDLLHTQQLEWGTSGRKFAGGVKDLVRQFIPTDILDYGCGKGTLARVLPEYRITGYDPGVADFTKTPKPHDLVICVDVLEHVEPDCLEDVLDDLQRVTRKVIMLQVANFTAKHFLPDGRNAHLILQPNKWWMLKLWERFTLLTYEHNDMGFHAVLGALNPKGNGVN